MSRPAKLRRASPPPASARQNGTAKATLQSSVTPHRPTRHRGPSPSAKLRRAGLVETEGVSEKGIAAYYLFRSVVCCPHHENLFQKRSLWLSPTRTFFRNAFCGQAAVWDGLLVRPFLSADLRNVPFCTLDLPAPPSTTAPQPAQKSESRSHVPQTRATRLPQECPTTQGGPVSSTPGG